MLVTCWSVKGGSGTTVVAASLTVLLARRLTDVVCVDLGGDVPATVGLPDPPGPGVAEWLSTEDAPDDALRRLEIGGGGGFTIVPSGRRRGGGVDPTADADRLLVALSRRTTVVVDAGPPSDLAFAVAASSTISLLVLRPCYLALRRALAAPCRPSAVVLVEEVKRSLDATDVAEVLGVPVCAVVPWDPAIARAVDAGLLGARLPRPLAAALRSAA